MTTTLKVNGRDVTVDADPDTPLLWVLRADLQLTGTKFGCGMSLCGACTVHANGAAIRSCTTLLKDVAGQDITTIEGVQGPEIAALRAAWTTVDVVQCGYCQSGQLMSACALLKANPRPDADAIRAAMSGNLCRCGTYQRIEEAIALAATPR
ncbi:MULTISPECIES: (2Fe-2S)-binding protein [Hydrogenophaga]|uniref:(2fe-2S)-binding domain-containing protein n=1 Tax=Hydrogenophaga intermedia TaxID=65786 RepID=A0A1L1PRM8_HYDIT|nr:MULTISPECIES: (2Fe-2S)-binding protein [Hydrogenophaga]AOS80600.1 isoquinoline 1-oxidoreductase [Hydrogenophaga sp. PBC]TMU78253.1 (2Fe-2S)-binding protein [Hydrogenophaga intermedia]CDN87251.1 (2fe-2S)-binding domain-containing protein [Hydrogenophaga intermedia]